MTLHTPTETVVPIVSAARRRRIKISSQFLAGLLGLLDTVSILGSALFVYFAFDITGDAVNQYIAAVTFVWLATLMLYQFGGLYQFDVIVRPGAVIDRLIVGFGTSVLLLLAAAFALKISSDLSRSGIAVFSGMSCTALLTMRWISAKIVRTLSEHNIFIRNVVIAGSGAQSRQLLQFLDHARPRFMSVLGVFVDEAGSSAKTFEKMPVLGDMSKLEEFARLNDVDDIIIAEPWSADSKIQSYVNRLRELPVNVYLSADLIGFKTSFRPPPSHYEEMPVVELVGKPLSGWDVVLKSTFDFVMALIALILFSPLLLLIAIAVKLDSPGPILFRQKRLGFNNSVFEIYKFRTMRADAGDAPKTVQATRDDPRVTRVGRILRRTSLDELPQLLNVLDGTMSLVGPRPHAIDHNEEYSRQIRGYFARHRVKPGITGWAQVHGLRGETRALEHMEQRVKYDVYYSENWSLWLDIRILIRTVWIAIRGQNAY
ncbi:MAG: undecaprenyl-phosphate glucose phosphotransferase [Hyphomicrobiales bacterium]